MHAAVRQRPRAWSMSDSAPSEGKEIRIGGLKGAPRCTLDPVLALGMGAVYIDRMYQSAPCSPWKGLARAPDVPVRRCTLWRSTYAREPHIKYEPTTKNKPARQTYEAWSNIFLVLESGPSLSSLRVRPWVLHLPPHPQQQQLQEQHRQQQQQQPQQQQQQKQQQQQQQHSVSTTTTTTTTTRSATATTTTSVAISAQAREYLG